jgi:hypothetical protein
MDETANATSSTRLSLAAEVEAWFAANPTADTITAATPPVVQALLLAMLEGSWGGENLATLRRGVMTVLLAPPSLIAAQAHEPAKAQALAAMLPAIRSYREVLDTHRTVAEACERLIHLALNTPARTGEAPTILRSIH